MRRRRLRGVATTAGSQETDTLYRGLKSHLEGRKSPARQIRLIATENVELQTMYEEAVPVQGASLARMVRLR